jgi:hypothetical protein
MTNTSTIAPSVIALNSCTFEPVCYHIMFHDNIFEGEIVDHLDDLLTGGIVGSLEHRVDGRFEPLDQVDEAQRDAHLACYAPPRSRHVLRPCGGSIDARGAINQAQELGLAVGGIVAQFVRDAPIFSPVVRKQ